MFGFIVLLHNPSALELEGHKLMAGHSPSGFSDRVQNSHGSINYCKSSMS